MQVYGEHIVPHDFDRPAQITWRELVVEVNKYPSRDVARQKANALYEKLRQGANSSSSPGPRVTVQPAPRSGRVDADLARRIRRPGREHRSPRLPIGKVSGILEGENSFHIVKVEERRSAGPASFEEVQDQIRSAILEKKYQEEAPPSSPSCVRKHSSERCSMARITVPRGKRNKV